MYKKDNFTCDEKGWSVATLTYHQSGHYDENGNQIVDYDSRQAVSPIEEFWDCYRTIAYMHGIEAARKWAHEFLSDEFGREYYNTNK